MSLSKEHWESRRRALKIALEEKARSVGKESALYKCMGTVAWGRHEGEPSPGETKDHVVYGVGFLEGVLYALQTTGRVLDMPGSSDLYRVRDKARMLQAEWERLG